MAQPPSSIPFAVASPEGESRRPEGEILFVTDRRVWHRSIGSEQRIAALVRFLCRRGAAVAIAYVGRIAPGDRSQLEAFRAECPGLSVIARGNGGRGLIRWILSAARSAADHAAGALETRRRRAFLDTQEPGIAGRRPSPARRAFVHRTIVERTPRVVVVEFLRLTNLVFPRPRLEGPSPLYLIDTHDVLHERAERYRAQGRRLDHEIDAEQEALALETFDAILAIQAAEGERLRTLVPSKPVLVVPHGIAIPEPPPRDAHATRHPMRIGFLGGRDESNLSSLDWFVEQVWPALRRELGDAIELRVAGQVCSAWPAPDAEGVRILGPIARIDDFWPEIDVAINPVRFGSGLKIKNVEALAYGCALLTTTIGAQGLEAASPEALRIADSAEDWIEALRHWASDADARATLGARGRDFAWTHLREEAAFEALTRYLEADPR